MMDSSDSIDAGEPAPDSLTTPAHGPIWIVLFVGLVVCTNVASAGWAAMPPTTATVAEPGLPITSSRAR
mgnify:CR=1 FL=1